VLTWTFVCAPIAVRTRLTLYWYLRKIAGPVTTTVYNILNAVLFCILAGCMITVSASAVRIPFGIPAQTLWYPQDIRFVLVVIAVGSVVVTLAILGFKTLARFAVVCSPWMFLMFIAGALAMLPALAAKTLDGQQIGTFRDFWTIANKGIWTGNVPGGGEPIGFWQVAAFAWICNLAMHAGLSDMALFRYARKASYGLYSAFGMFLGHYLAWICAGIMGAATALILGESMNQLDAGGVAWQALGISGIIAVVIAGWTTSNPTLYRAGLAFQAVTPGWPRWLVTLVAGAVTTTVACFPFVFTKLLDFVALYGLLLSPVGAIVLVEHWIFPLLGLTQFWVSRKKLFVSWPALLSWGIAIAAALALERTATLHLFFLFVPVCFLTAVLYLVFSLVAGAREKFTRQDREKTHENGICDTVPAETLIEIQARHTSKSGKDAVLWISGIIVVASLLACLILPVWVYITAGSSYDQNFATFRNILICPTLIYFVAGTIWAVKIDKPKLL
ncbi:MAG: nucleoside transporter, partial [Planctomycetota bacterium]